MTVIMKRLIKANPTLNVCVQEMHNIEDVKLIQLFDYNSKYLQSMQISYKLNGKLKSYDLMKFFNSVAVLIYNSTTKKLVFVRQFRPAIYLKHIPFEIRYNKPIDLKKYPPSLGVTLELCSGIIDKEVSLVEIAKEEVLEECGFNVPLNKLQKIHHFNAYNAVANIITIFYCQVNKDMKLSEGNNAQRGGINDEAITIAELSLAECQKEMNFAPFKNPASLIIGFYWFLYHKSKQVDCK